MSLRSAAAAVLLVALAACKPSVKGLCSEQGDCRDGSYCSLDGICLAASGTCAPACGAGEICSGSACAPLKPVVQIVAPPGPLSPALPQVTVHIEVSPAIALRRLSVEVDTDQAVASGAIDAPAAGDDVVTLGSFKAGIVGNASVRATLTYQPPGAAEESTLQSVALPAMIDAAPPVVTVFVPEGQGEVDGWLARTSGNVEVRATVEDGSGTGPQAATLKFDKCPSGVACTYRGSQDPVHPFVFVFQVPRFAQSAGSEAPLPVTVTATDVAGNSGTGSLTLQIDDAAPQLGTVALVSNSGVTGEDGKTWFSNAADVEIAVPVLDQGSGFDSVVAHVTDGDIAGPDPVPVPQADGTVHFVLPATKVHGRENGLHFSLTAKDKLGRSAAKPVNQVNVDAALPSFSVPHVVYSSATPVGACGPSDSSGPAGPFACGRQGATRVLRDDTATVTFDASDCGAGITNSGNPAAIVLNVTSGGQTKSVAVHQTGRDDGSCANGSNNQVHHYSASVAIADAAPSLDTPAADGTVQVHLVSTGPDRIGNSSQSAAGTVSPEGIALVSLWRWKAKPGEVAAGSPALLPGASGSRNVVVGTTGTGSNLFALGLDGSPIWSAALTPDIVGDVAVGQAGAVYASTDASCTSTFPGCIAINVVPPGGTPAAPCMASSAHWGASPAIGTSGGADLLYAIAVSRNTLGANNIYSFSPGASCSAAGGGVVQPVADDVTGVSVGTGAVFVSHGHGFTSIDQSGAGFGTTQVQFDTGSGNNSFMTPSPPSISSDSGRGGAVFDNTGGAPLLRRTVRQTSGCGLLSLTACWETAGGFPPPQPPAPSNLPYTPVFDGTNIWTIDDQGVVFVWAQQSGANVASLDLTEPASPPILLQGGSALVTTNSGLVKVLSLSGSTLTALQLMSLGPASFSTSRIPPPVVDCSRGSACDTTGVAYVPGPTGWVFAVQVPSAPVAASSTVWPRPGHDSCNTRNAGSSCP